MNNKNRNDAKEWWALVDELRESNLAHVDKVLRAFNFATDQLIAHGQHEIELSRAMKDQESVIRGQIKTETLKYSQKTLRDCYILFVGRDYDDE